MIRGVRGAVQASRNDPSAILQAAKDVMRSLIEANAIRQESVASVFFTVTRDLDAAFPAEVRSKIGWDLVPFLCGVEIPVPGSMERVIRVLILFETGESQVKLKHQYLGVTNSLRPDLKK